MISDHVLVWFLLMINNDSCLVSVNLSIPKKSLDEVITEIVTKQIPGNSGQRCMPQTRTCCDLPWLGVHLPRHYRLWTSSYVVIMEKPWWQFANSTRLYIHTNRKHNVWLPRPPVQSCPRKSSTRSSPSKLRRNKRRNLSPKTSIATRRLPGFPKTWIT